ncbi:MAG: molybdopterin-dependent oxidoreductase [Acidimicrobiales bacterium]
MPAWWYGLVAGVLAGAAAVGAGQLAAGIVGPLSSPIAQVGQLQIAIAPQWLETFAIRTFGPNDKRALVVGIMVILGLIAAGLGILALHRLVFGLIGLSVLTAFGLFASVSRPDFSPVDSVPTVVAALVGVVALCVLVRSAPPKPFAVVRLPGSQERLPDLSTTGTTLVDRRQFLTLGVGTAMVTAAAVVGGGVLGERLSVAALRAALVLPSPRRPTRPLPPGAELHIPGLAPFVTPNAQFYRVDTAIILPEINPNNWHLVIHGMVDKEIDLSFDDLLRMPLTEHYITLTCVSNPVGGPYIGNADWLGASLATVLRRAGIQSGAEQLLSTSTDGYTCSTPVEAVMDGRDALLAVGMNGSPLPIAHGFPVRMVLPGLYGYVSATKWLTDIKVTTYAAEAAYWTERGWAQRGPIKTESRIDVPRPGGPIPPGRTTVAGVAWAQHKGIDAVEVSVDSGPWHSAHLAAVPGIDTWRQWVWNWEATRGTHTLQARATDATGYTQTASIAGTVPNGATGYPTVVVTVGSV